MHQVSHLVSWFLARLADLAVECWCVAMLSCPELSHNFAAVSKHSSLAERIEHVDRGPVSR